MYFIKFVSYWKKRERKRNDERGREGKEINGKRKKGLISDLQLRGYASLLFEKAIPDYAIIK